VIPDRIRDWLDDRTGWRAARRHVLDEPLPPGTGWWFTLGSVLLAALALQAVTGVLLSLTYAPTPDHAHDSVRYIETSIRAGRLLRGLHHYGASLIVIAAVLHMARVIAFGSYKPPRELTWLSGLALLLILFAFALTGYLLPWDQRAYWATVVTINIAALAPVAGSTVAALLRGGPEIGALTLTRWYAAHVIVLPAMLAGLVGVHLWLMRRKGISGPIIEPGSNFPVQTFYPYQAARDLAVALAAVAVLVAIAWQGAPPLEPIADPADAAYVPRPEWYFLGLFQLLKWFPGRLEIVGAIIIPACAIAALALLPWIDRSPTRRLRDRRGVLSVAGAALLAIAALTAAGWRDRPATRPRDWTIREIGGASMIGEAACTRCHADGSAADPLEPAALTRDARWIGGHILDPEMIVPGVREPPDSRERDAAAILAFLARARRGEAAPALPADTVTAMRVFARYCIGCHQIDGLASDGGDEGPNLTRIGQKHDAPALARWVSDPESVKAFADMPAFGLRLTADEMRAVTEWLASRR